MFNFITTSGRPTGPFPPFMVDPSNLFPPWTTAQGGCQFVNIVASEIYSEFYLFLSRNCEIYTESKGKSRLYTAFVFIWEAERVKANLARFSKKPTYSKGKTKAKQRARMQEQRWESETCTQVKTRTTGRSRVYIYIYIFLEHSWYFNSASFLHNSFFFFFTFKKFRFLIS